MKSLLAAVISVFALFETTAAQALTVPGPLVDTSWLQRHAKQVVILDVRDDVKSFTGKPILTRDKKSGDYVVLRIGAHIPGANLVNYKKIRVDRVVDGKKVEKIIPVKADFEKMMQAVAVRKDRPVIIVSEGMNDLDLTMATRLYWQLKYFGEDNLAILNGGMAQWLTNRKPISNKPSQPQPGDWVATAERKELLATTDDVRQGMKNGVQLVDNRPLFQYMGVMKKSYVYAKGHIPGAKSYPTSLFTDHNKPAKLLSVDKLRDLAQGMGIDPNAQTITYCNSGHLASGGWFVMHELMGNKNVKLYDGSMNEWTLNKGKTTEMKME
jgi:thiosulfate/3-mercaptopyruvate sulfurtransferase